MLLFTNIFMKTKVAYLIFETSKKLCFFGMFNNDYVKRFYLFLKLIKNFEACFTLISWRFNQSVAIDISTLLLNRTSEINHQKSH